MAELGADSVPSRERPLRGTTASVDDGSLGEEGDVDASGRKAVGVPTWDTLRSPPLRTSTRQMAAAGSSGRPWASITITGIPEAGTVPERLDSSMIAGEWATDGCHPGGKPVETDPWGSSATLGSRDTRMDDVWTVVTVVVDGCREDHVRQSGSMRKEPIAERRVM
jgi:hypothetical protein